MNFIKGKLYRALRWSEKYTKTDMVYLTTGGFWLSSSYLLTSLFSFFTTVAFGYLLSKNAYGDYRYVLSVFALLSAFTLTGINTAIVQSVAAGYDGALKQGSQLAIKWSIFAVAGTLLGAGYYFFKNNIFLATSLLVIALTIPLQLGWSVFAGYINGKKDYLHLSVFNLINTTIPSVFTILALFFTKNVLMLLVTYFLTSTVLNLLFYIQTIRLFKPSDNVDPGLEKYSIKLSLLNVINHVAVHIDKVIVYTSLGAVELAVYGFATAFPDRIRSLVKNLNTLMVPKFTENNINKRNINLKRKTIQLGLVLIAITILYILLAPFLYSIFFPKYPESVYYSQILSLMILSSVAMIPLSLFIAQKKETDFAKATMGGSLFQILLLVPSAHFWGLTGVAISRVLGSYAIVGISFLLLQKKNKNVD